MEEKQKLTIKIDYKENLTVAELKNFLGAINNQFEKQCKIDNKTDCLLIKEVRKGSIEIDIIAMAVIFADIGNLISTFNNIKLAIEWLKTKVGDKPKMNLEDLNDYKNIIAPASNHDGTQVIMQNDIQDNSGKIVNIGTLNINSDGGRIANKNINEEIVDLQKSKKNDKEETSNLHSKVILRLKQINDNVNDNKNTKGIIEDIDKKAYPIVSDEGVKKLLVHGRDNPIEKIYLVNVKANRLNGKLSSYTILEVIDSYYLEEDPEIF